MNKEKEALLKEILAQPDVPRKVAPKNVLRFVDRMQPKTQDMRDYLMAIFSSETQAESSAIREAWCAKMTPNERKLFSDAYFRCIKNGLNSNKQISSTSVVEELAHAS
jgi:arylamine N-acetyltransferase